MRDEAPMGEVLVASWGNDEENDVYEYLQVISHFVSLECLKNFYDDGMAADLDTHICLVNIDDSDSVICDGSTGSPVFDMRNEIFYQIGILSGSNDCETFIATKVSHITNWIKYELKKAMFAKILSTE